MASGVGGVGGPGGVYQPQGQGSNVSQEIQQLQQQLMKILDQVNNGEPYNKAVSQISNLMVQMANLMNSLPMPASKTTVDALAVVQKDLENAEQSAIDKNPTALAFDLNQARLDFQNVN